MQRDSDKMVWVEKYRPKTVSECILPDRIKKPFLAYVQKKEFPNLLLSGSAGTGKTTIAKALCNDLGYDVIVINASDERNIDVVRGRISEFASQTSLSGNKKAIILDEADGLNLQSAQPALRAAIEDFKDVRFILTCNYKNRIMEAIHSRTSTVSFNVKKDEKTKTAVSFLKRVFEILKAEEVPFDKEVVAAVVKKYYPDNRRILNELQAYSVAGEIDTGLLSAMDKASIGELIKACKDKDIGKIRKWLVDNIDTDPTVLFDEIYKSFYSVVKPESVPELIILLGEYQYKSAHVANQEINMMAFLTQVVGNVEFK